LFYISENLLQISEMLCASSMGHRSWSATQQHHLQSAASPTSFVRV